MSPATPVLEIRPPVVASPNAWVRRSNSDHVAPAPQRAVRSGASTVTRLSARRSMTTPPSLTPSPATEWPPPRTATGSSDPRAYASASATSSSSQQRAISAGRRSTIPLNTARASS